MNTHKLLNTFVAVTLFIFVSGASAQVPEVTGKIVNSCLTQAKDAAGDWYQACLELGGLDLGGLDGYVSEEVVEQRCSEHAQTMYSYVLQECQSNLFQVYRPRFIE